MKKEYEELYVRLSYVILQAKEEDLEVAIVQEMIANDINRFIPNVSEYATECIISTCTLIADEVYQLAYSREISLVTIRRKVLELLEVVFKNDNYYQISQQLKQIWRDNE